MPGGSIHGLNLSSLLFQIRANAFTLAISTTINRPIVEFIRLLMMEIQPAPSLSAIAIVSLWFLLMGMVRNSRANKPSVRYADNLLINYLFILFSSIFLRLINFYYLNYDQ